jgi:hypothetical protein
MEVVLEGHLPFASGCEPSGHGAIVVVGCCCDVDDASEDSVVVVFVP